MDDEQGLDAGEAQVQSETPTETNNEPEQTETETVSNESGTQDDTGNEEERTADIKKPTRSERRIKDLLGKLKTKDEPTQVNYPNFPQFNNDPYQNLDSLTPDQLRGLIVQEADKIAQVRIAQSDQVKAYQDKVTQHVSDLEQTAEQIEKDFAKDPETAKQINEMLVELNEQANIENGRLVPRVKTSVLYERIKKTLNRERLNGQSEVSVSMAKRLANESPKPKTSTEKSTSTDELRANLWKNPKAVREELEKRLPVSE